MLRWLNILLLVLGLAGEVRAEDEIVDSPEPKTLNLYDASVPPVTNVQPPEDVLEPATNVLQLLKIGVRIDPGLSLGSPTQQGFALNSVRLSLSGDLNETFDYRLSFGQTREFSSALIPQITPVEAYLTAKSPRFGILPALKARVGLFTPSFHPLWSPDLSDLDIIDYSAAHRDLFIGRDLGLEAAFSSSSTGFTLGGGIFNGIGPTTINSNSTKAFLGFVRQQWGKESYFALGASGYWLGQSAIGSINYKANSMGLVYFDVNLARPGVRLVGEMLYGTFEDSTRTTRPSGGGVTAWAKIIEGIRLYLRYSEISSSPVGSGLGRQQWLGGPVFDLAPEIKLFAHYEVLRYSDRSIENQFLLRFRLNL